MGHLRTLLTKDINLDFRWIRWDNYIILVYVYIYLSVQCIYYNMFLSNYIQELLLI